MAGTIWIPGAERLKPSQDGGTMSGGKPRVVWHTTEADPGTAAVWSAMIRVLTGKSAEPQVLYDPLTDRLGQFLPLNVSGRALKNDGATRTNRVGSVCIQIEVIGRSAKPFTDNWKPGKNFRALMASIRSWGISDVWPAGAPPRFIASPPHNVPENPRSRSIWINRAGHFSHSQIPGNDHGDPGAIDIKKLFAAAAVAPPTKPPATTEEDSMAALTKADITAAFKDALAAERPSEDGRQTFDNKHDAQAGAWLASATGYAVHRHAELAAQGVPVADAIPQVKDEIWGPISPLWNGS